MRFTSKQKGREFATTIKLFQCPECKRIIPKNVPLEVNKINFECPCLSSPKNEISNSGAIIPIWYELGQRSFIECGLFIF